MPRNLSPDTITALSSPNFYAALFLNLTFGTISDHVVTPIPVFIWSGVGSVVWQGHTYIGLGNLLEVGVADEGSQIEARGITITISGINPNNPAQLSTALSQIVLGLPVALYLALYDGSGGLIDIPCISWQGRMDQPTWSITSTEIKLTLACESRLLDLNTDISRRLTTEDQQMQWPGDTGFQWVCGLQEQTLNWGNYPSSSTNL